MGIKRVKKRRLPERQPAGGLYQEQRREIGGILLIFLALAGLWTLWGGRDDGGVVVTALRLVCTYLVGEALCFLPFLYLLGFGLYLVKIGRAHV